MRRSIGLSRNDGPGARFNQVLSRDTERERYAERERAGDQARREGCLVDTIIIIIIIIKMINIPAYNQALPC